MSGAPSFFPRLSTKRVVSWDLDGSDGYANTTAVVGFTTAYDPASDKLYERALHAEGRSALYPSYDSADRLLEYQRGTLASGGGSVATPISLPGTDKDRTYDLDGLGNWKNTAFAPVGGSATREVRRHDALNAVTRFGTTPVSYDHGDNGTSPDPLVSQRGNGNIAADGTLVLKYDALNRMSEAFLADGTTQIAAYAYDAMGRRIRKVVTNGGVSGDSALNGTTDYLYDGVQCVEERNGSDAAIRLFIWGRYVDDCVSMQTLVTLGGGALPADIYIPFSDLLYRSALLTNSSAAPVEAYDTDAYGNTLAYKAAGTSGTWFADDAVLTDNPALQYIFTGRQIDPETALYYYRARYYHPHLGRFVSRDPAGYRDGASLYQFVKSNPLIRLDSNGLQQTIIEVPPISIPVNPSSPNERGRNDQQLTGGTPLDPLLGQPKGSSYPSLPPVPENESDYRTLTPPKYDPNTNPNRDCEKPCNDYVKNYKKDEQAIRNYVQKDHPKPKSQWGCTDYMGYYDLILKLWHDRILSDNCHMRHGVSDAQSLKGHSSASNETATWRQTTYELMRKRCEEEWLANMPPVKS